jgi:hypothetical protein
MYRILSTSISNLARIIHDDFYCNRRYAAVTSWHAVARHASGRAESFESLHTNLSCLHFDFTVMKVLKGKKAAWPIPG